ncbi:hypothetical protein [Bradyrhizobium rifense]|uniref:hypothetical protein n=1 Tax=Bradyrhizobium rifense TaxID=515499 RepID=UPI001652E69A|nr:hypothetical protein [Bradyrhizobium rifense]
MQKFSYEPSASERGLLRKWRLAVVGFYGSLLALIVVFAFATDQNVQVVHKDSLLASRK